eukprot:3466147-Amphidinium_carterae.2
MLLRSKVGENALCSLSSSFSCYLDCIGNRLLETGWQVLGKVHGEDMCWKICVKVRTIIANELHADPPPSSGIPDPEKELNQ